MGRTPVSTSTPTPEELGRPGEPRPADAARQALRAARERREGVPEAGVGQGAGPGDPASPQPEPGPEPGTSWQEEPLPTGPERPGPRPADAARAALRHAVTARRRAQTEVGDERDETASSDAGPTSSDAGPTESTGGTLTGRAGVEEDPPEGAEPSASAVRGGGTEGHGARPADVARHALRAAREETRRPRTDQPDGEAEGVREAGRPAPGGSAAGSDARRRAADLRVRSMRELLAGAFEMPEADEPRRDDSSTAAPPRSRRTPPAGRSSTTPSAPPSTPPTASSPLPEPTHTDSSLPPLTPPTGTEPTTAPEPTTPRVPQSMAAPGRDGELRRTFPAFPVVASGAPDDTRFARTWWGNAWVTALEEGALDPKRLARGRGYAEQGHVDAITVTPGLVLAYVRGSRPRPYRVQVRLRTLDDGDWARFLDAVADRPGHIAALLDGEMPQSLAECGVPLLPGPGDLAPRCSCPDRGHPCKHAAALCYQTARLLDADPFVLLLLRGRGERELLDALSRLSAARAARAAQEQEPEPLPGVRATDALAPQRQLPPLPAPLPVPAHPEQPPAYPAAPGGPDPFALDQLATDAAARAHALLSTGRDPVADLTLWQDAVRLAAARPGSGLTAATRALYSSLASAAGRTTAELARAVAAWRQGGPEGLAVLEEPWDPPAGRFDRARPLLLAADLPAFRPWRNRLTHPRGHVQLRLGRDGLWYPYESEPGHDDWWPRGTPDLDPVGALTGLGASPEG
ncbi:SWIM zinc finger family protein [Streptomyces curacoi]|nr:SWIM zinc finger family protein [Streptomyces curacoi]